MGEVCALLRFYVSRCRIQQTFLRNNFKQFDRHGTAGGESAQTGTHDNE